jgi:hypothetical protein
MRVFFQPSNSILWLAAPPQRLIKEWGEKLVAAFDRIGTVLEVVWIEYLDIVRLERRQGLAVVIDPACSFRETLESVAGAIDALPVSDRLHVWPLSPCNAALPSIREAGHTLLSPQESPVRAAASRRRGSLRLVE